MTATVPARFFTSLNDELGRRSASALLGALGPASAPLRARLREVLLAPPGEGASFLADPVFEAIFDWLPSPRTMAALAEEGLLTRELVQAMATASDDPVLRDYRFPTERSPYLHQEQAWRHLLGDEARSVLVTSGTGSGKTECFLVPILEHLSRARRSEGRLTGVRALFLYPLNALINSQRDRLRAWCAPFGGDIRFCLYNGETPERAGAASRGSPEQVRDRKGLREDPPPILVTNSTMLEYLLIRREDQRIVDPSRGKLRWIVLDEAHTYLGSHAAEMALLLRRVLHSFQVDASQVRFVATSATIGDDTEESAVRLRRFLADLAGVDPERVSIVRGSPLKPRLPARFEERNAPLPPLEALSAMGPAERFEALAGNAGVRRMRVQLLERGAMTLSAMTWARKGTAPSEKAAEYAPPGEREETAALVDLCTCAESEGEALLRARAHLFHRTQAGLWVCMNPVCAGREGTPLADAAWPFGKLFLERRLACDTCGSMVLDLVLCDECGAEYAYAEMRPGEDGWRLEPRDPGDVSDAEEYRELVEPDEDAEADGPDTARFPRLLGARGRSRDLTFDLRTGVVDPEPVDGSETAVFGELSSESSDEHAIRCAHCGQVERHPDDLFRDARRGGPFFLRGIIPLLIDHTPPHPERERGLPSKGRRLITFTDSRQGTARFALDAQLDAERNYVRGLVYHLLADRRMGTGRGDTTGLEAEVRALENVVGMNPTLQGILESKRRELAAAREPVLGRLTWREAADQLSQDEAIGTWMRQHWRHIPLSDLTPAQIADLVLLREFLRRPKRQNSMETLGLAALEYPGLDGSPPVPWQMRGLDAEEWRRFLKTAVDFTVRGSTAVQVEDEYLRWLGVPVRRKVLLGPASERGPERTVRWPTIAGARPSNRLIQLLARVLHVAPGDAEVDQCLYAAWEQVRPLLRQTADGYVLALRERAVLREVQDAWLCPVTRRVLDTTVCGITPYVSTGMSEAAAVCLPIRMPALPLPFWRRGDGSDVAREEVEAWVAGSEEIRALEPVGVWSDLSDRIIRPVKYFQTAEHSAQQSAARLRQLEDAFKAGRVNLLSCSTTMEMGVDIGGLSGVAMNNPPPSPANYRQRAGRAGRRGETRAFSLTLCKNNPHGEWIFGRPMWPFETPTHVTEVTLTSERLVQRHVNSLALTRFFAAFLGTGVLPQLEAGPFFQPAGAAASPCERLERWLLDGGPGDEWLGAGLERLVRRSVLQGAGPRRLLANTHEAIRAVRERWLAELEPLERELAGFDDAPETRAPRRAVELRLARMRGEYLLRELALRGFLPGYGFPTQVVPFVTTTAEDLDRARRASEEKERDDNLVLSRGYPSRDVAVALRDYAPGGTVVVDGRVLEVGGLTLHWKVPVGDQVREVQALRWAWRCPHCGDTGTSLQMPVGCRSDACAGRGQALDAQQYIEPSGFAVDIRYKASNDLTRNEYLPVEQPWITGGGEAWLALPDPDLGRYRYSARGQIFSYSRGRYGEGYALCLRCGRAASEVRAAALPGDAPEEMLQHRPLRGAADAGVHGVCRGNGVPGLVQRNLWLGAAKETDVFELQLREPETGAVLADRGAASAIAVALRQALAERLSVEEREIGWACTPARVAETRERTWSIVLFDTATGGAGFVARTAAELPVLLRRAREILTCPRACDSACHACLLTYDTHHHARALNRRTALSLLTERFLDGLRLAEEARMFGPGTVLEFEPLAAALHRELRRAGRLRLVLAGSPDGWELEAWPLEDWVRRWSTDGVAVEVVVPESVLARLDAPSRGRLAAWVEAEIATVLTVAETPPAGGAGRVIACVGGAAHHVCFGVFEEAARTPSAAWAVGTGSAYVVRAEFDGPLPPDDAARQRTGAELRGAAPGSARAIAVDHEMDGPVDGFGDRFWEHVLPAAPAARDRLSAGERLVSVGYADRYLVTPLALRLLAEVLRSLRDRFPAAAENARVEVVTAAQHPQRRKSAWIQDNWPPDTDRARIFAEIAASWGVGGTLVERPKPQTPHVRELSLEWEDGCTWRIRPDEGFGFMQTAGAPVSFRFDEGEAEQGRMIRETAFTAESRIATTLYVFDLERGGSGTDSLVQRDEKEHVPT